MTVMHADDPIVVTPAETDRPTAAVPQARFAIDGRRAWRSNKPLIIYGLCAIALCLILAAMLGVGTIGIVFTAISSCTLVGTILLVSITQNDDVASRRFADIEQSRQQWVARCQALNTEFEQTATALTQLNDGVIVMSPEGQILLINPAARRLLTISETDDFIGRVFAEVVRMPDINELISASRRTTEPQVGTVEIADGNAVRPLRVNVNPIGRETNSQSGTNLLLILRDETETRRLEEMRREFVANVSHELKTPLAAIKGYAETVELAIKDDPDAAAHFMGQLHNQCLRLERLVEDMMQLARAQAGTHNMTLTRISLGDVIADAMKACRPIAESKRIQLTVCDEASRAIVIADREATLTIANNLVSNSVRYTPEGGHVQIRTEDHGDYWALAVQDNGVGIPEDEQERVFERFYRVDKNRQSTGGGTGIGLSIVKNLTLAQSGEVRLTSRPGEGSTFRVLLPAAELPTDGSPVSHTELIKPSSPIGS